LRTPNTTRSGTPPGLPALAARALATMTPFTPAEAALLAAAEAHAPAGMVADPALADQWGPERRVRPEVLRWLCLDPLARERVAPAGLRLRGLSLTGPVDLDRARIPFPLAFAHCALGAGLNLARAEVARLTLSGCRAGPVRCDRLTAHGPVAFADGTRILGGVRLGEALILGDLVLTGAKLLNPGAVALAATALRVEGDLCLDGGFEAQGAVRLLDAAVTGRLDLRGGRFLNRGGVALACDRIQVASESRLDGDFKAYGQVRFMDAHLAKVRGTAPLHGAAVTRDARAARRRALEAGA
jgi:hypothetical protein